MSAPKQLLKNVDEISIGFLSAKTSTALGHALQDTALTASDREALDDAAVLLERIADGASIAATGVARQGVSPTGSMAAFDMVLGPLEALSEIANEGDELDSYFSSLATSVRTLLANGDAQAQKPELRRAQQFFDMMKGWLSSELNTRRVTQGIRQLGFA